MVVFYKKKTPAYLVSLFVGYSSFVFILKKCWLILGQTYDHSVPEYTAETPHPAKHTCMVDQTQEHRIHRRYG